MASDHGATTSATKSVEDTGSDSLMTLVSWVARLLYEREEARAQAQAAAQTTRQMEAFLGIATHELKTPVTSSSLGVRLVARRLDVLLDRLRQHDPELAGQLAATQGLLAQAQEGIDRLSRMMTDLLDLSRVHEGQLAVRPALRDLQTIVRAVVDEQRKVAPTRRIRLHLPARQDIRAISVWADADRIHQVGINFLTNARKYSASDQPVDVRVQQHAGWARVSVRDYGPGLPPDEQERIWEPFHRAEGIPVIGTPADVHAQSLGLGLHICKVIIEQHHGHVGVQSAPGRGSTFWFALPVVRLNRGMEQRSEPYSA